MMEPMNERTNLSEVQKVEYNILCLFKRICEKYGLRYYLSGGTLLGAVRHKGSIPWYDDIDVSMPYTDYLSFLNVAQNELGDDYFVQNQETENNFPSPFTKIRLNNSTFLDSSFKNWHINHGIWIDIFPIINIEPKRHSSISRVLKVCKILQMDDLIESNKKVFCDIYGKNIVNVMRILYKGVPIEKRKKIHGSLLKRICADNDSEYCAELVGSQLVLLPNDIYSDSAELIFEDDTFSVPCNYKKYLELNYGDYMELPPIEERKGLHADIIDLNKPINYICDDFI